MLTSLCEGQFGPQVKAEDSEPIGRDTEPSPGLRPPSPIRWERGWGSGFRSVLRTGKPPRRGRLSGTAAGILWVCFAGNCVGAGSDWPVVGGEPGGSRYSSLVQIN